MFTRQYSRNELHARAYPRSGHSGQYGKLNFLKSFKNIQTVLQSETYFTIIVHRGLKGLKSPRPSKSWICLFYLYNAGIFYSVLQRTASLCLLRSLQSNVLIIFILTHAPSSAPGCGGKICAHRGIPTQYKEYIKTPL